MDLSKNYYVGHEELKSTDLMKRYKILETIGNGAFATVYKATSTFCPTNAGVVALKLMVIDKIAKRRQEKKRKKGTSNYDDDKGGRSFFEEEDDTDQLFFPSRYDDDTLFTSCRTQKRPQNILEIQDMVKREIEVHQIVSQKAHPNIVSLVESFHYQISPKKTSVCAIALEYCSLGDLHNYMKQVREMRKTICDISPWNNTFLDENETRHVLIHVLRGLAYIHSLGIAHRDIKPGNIFISPNKECGMEMSDGKMFSLLDCVLKIGDFGLAVKMSDYDDWDEANHNLCGTPSCLAPEVALLGNKNRISTTICPKSEFPDHSLYNAISGIKGYGQPADLWSTGCLMYAMLCGEYPFSRQGQNCSGDTRKEERIKETIERVLDGRWSIPDGIMVSFQARSLLNCLLSTNPKDRGFARGLLSMQPFLSSTHQLPDAMNCSLNEKCSNLSEANSAHTVSIVSLPYIRHKTHIFQQGFKTFYSKSPASLKESEFSKCEDHLLEPIPYLRYIFPGRYAWKETSKSGVQLFLEMFVLPKLLGVVIQCQRISNRSNMTGLWMHLAGSGSHVCVGKLAIEALPKFTCRSHFENLALDPSSVQLLNDAFTRRPRKYKCHPIVVEQNYAGYDQTWNTTKSYSMNSSSLQSTICSTPSSIACSQQTLAEPMHRTKKLYKPLATLLAKKNDSTLTIYRLMKTYLNKIDRIHSSFFMRIHVFANNQRGSHICSVTTASLNNTKYFILNFEDSLEIRYSPSKESGELRGFVDNNLEARIEYIHFDLESQRLALASSQKSQQYFFHLQFAHEAIKKCLEYFEANFLLANKMPINVEARGRSSNEWHIVS